MRSGGVVLIGASGEPDEAGYRARLFLPTGQSVPLDDESTPYRPDDPGTYLRSVSSVDEERFWVANFHEYDIRLLDDGTR